MLIESNFWLGIIAAIGAIRCVFSAQIYVIEIHATCGHKRIKNLNASLYSIRKWLSDKLKSNK